MTAGLSRWQDVFAPGARVLLIVNSAASQTDEVERTLAAIERTSGLAALSVIAPSALRPRLLQRGLSASAVLQPRIAGLEVEFSDFLERGHVVHWALRRRASLVLGTEPYAPGNEEVKAAFERRVAATLGAGRFVAHALPDDEQTLLLTADDLWRRAGRPQALERHRARLDETIARLHESWRAGEAPVDASTIAPRLLASAAVAGEPPAVADARRYAYERLQAALLDADARCGDEELRVVTDPTGAAPASGWLPERLRAIGRSEYVDPAVRWHGTRLLVRGRTGGPFAYLLKSRPMRLGRGDALVAAGRLFRGGVTIGLEGADGRWASRTDVEEPGAFLAAAGARTAGTYALVIANHIKGDDQRAGLVLHRFGLARARR